MAGMFGGIISLLKASILMINAIAILSEERFLAPIGWSSAQAQAQIQQQSSYSQQPYGGDPNLGFGNPNAPEVGVKVKLISLIGAVRTLMRIPLIVFNLLFIVYEVLLGG